jgi:hypothetical protein
LEKGSKGAPARGRWVAKLRRQGKGGGGQKRCRRCAKERKQIVFIIIFKLNFLFPQKKKKKTITKTACNSL